MTAVILFAIAFATALAALTLHGLASQAVYWLWASPSTGITAPLTPREASPARWVSDEMTLVSAAAP